MMCPSGNYSDTLTYNKLLAEYVCPSSIPLPHLNTKKKIIKKLVPVVKCSTAELPAAYKTF